MNALTRSVVGALLLGVLWAAAAMADEPWDKPVLDAEQLSETLETVRTQIAQDSAATDDKTQQQVGLLTAREALLVELIRVVRGMAGLRDAEEIDGERVAAEEALRTARDRVLDLEAVRPTTPEELKPYESAERTARANLEAATAAYDRRESRRAVLADEVANSLPERLAAAERGLQAAPIESADDLETLEVENLRLARRTVLEKLAFAQHVLPRWRLHLQVLDAERELARLELTEHAQLLEAARSSLQAAAAAQAAREREEADRATRDAERVADPIERFRLAVRAEIQHSESERTGEVSVLAGLDNRLAADRAVLERWRLTRGRLEARLQLAGETAERAALLLRRTRDRVQRADYLLRETQMPALARTSDRIHRARTRVEDLVWELEAPESEHERWEALLGSLGAQRVAREAEARRVYREEVLDSRTGLLHTLRIRLEGLNHIETRIRDLGSVHADTSRTLDGLSRFIRSRIYWLRSDPPLSLALLQEAGAEIEGVPEIVSGPDMIGGLAESFNASPLRFVLLFVGIAVLLPAAFVLRRRLLARKERPVRSTNPLLVTLRRLLYAAAHALPGPALLVLVGLLLQMAQPPPGLLEVSTRVLYGLAGGWFVRSLLRRCLQPGGLIVEQLRTAQPVADQLWRTVNIVSLAYLFAYVPEQALSGPPFGFTVLPRLLHLVFLVVLVVALWGLLPMRRPLVAGWLQRTPSARKAWRVIMPLLALAFAAVPVMDALGYRVGAEFIGRNIVLSLILVLAAVGIYRLLKQVITRVGQRLRARAGQEGSLQEGMELSTAVTDQLTRVVRAGVILTTVLALFGLWNLSTGFTELFERVRITQVSGGVYLTLWDVIVAALWIIGGHFVVSNLQALFDGLVLPLIGKAEDRGGRYVALVLSRYVILIVAYSAALMSLHFSFSSIGWLLAAASFGIGFGLQEIIVNFVSGLILLFERPVRVGDMVTVDDTIGRVGEISVRATVITNMQNQQVIVPNKQLITGTVINWSRNDAFMRATANVGVAYGSDVPKVLRILREVIESEPGVRRDPKPQYVFDQFGASSLDFEVRYFVRIEDRIPMRTRLNQEINRRFAEEGVTIPFPQRDLHVRSVDDAAFRDAFRDESAPHGEESSPSS